MAGGIYFWNTTSTQQSVTPGGIGANSTVSVNVSLPGLLLTDIVLAVVKPTYTAGVDVSWVGQTTAGILPVIFQNSTAGTVTPPTEQYKFVIYRAEKPPGTPDGFSNGAVIFQ